MRLFASMGMGILVALLLFALMQGMVAGGQTGFKATEDVTFVDFVRIAQEEVTRVKERELPKKPEPPKKPETPQQQIQTQETVEGPQLDMDLPKLDVPFGAGGGPWLGSGGATANFGDGDVIPMVRFDPQWPREALLNGIEGYVTIEFTILEDGSVADPKVIDSSPPRLFDREALRAIVRWKFKPRIVDGRPVRRQAVQTINFKLEDEEGR